MSTLAGEFAGGHAEVLGNIAPHIPSPAISARNELAGTLLANAETWAHGPGSVGWNQWPEDIDNANLPRVPGLVRIGTKVETDLPLLVPVLGEGHLVVGNPSLLIPVRPKEVSGLPIGELKEAGRQAELHAAEQNRVRLRALQSERLVAAAISRNLMTRTFATMPSGTVRATVYDPAGWGKEFREFAPLAQHGLYDIVGSSGLPKLLAELEADILQMNGSDLGGYANFRELAAAGGPLPRPWRLVTLLGYRDVLKAEDQRRLNAIMRQGVDCGVSFIVHGFQTKEQPSTHRVRLSTDGRNAATTSVGKLTIVLDQPAPTRVAQRVARAAAQPATPWDSAATRIRPVFASDGSLPGAHYRSEIASRQYAERYATETMRTFRETFPLLTPTFLNEFAPSLGTYLAFADRAAEDPAFARQSARSAFENGSAIEQLEAWAMLQLLRSTPGNTRAHVTQIGRGGTASHIIGIRTRQLIQNVAITAHHGQEMLPELVRPYIGQYLHEDPPGYAFQLVAGIATRGSIGSRPETPRALESVAYHLEQTYSCVLRDQSGQVANQPLTECLIECEMLRLYGFETASDPLRVLLAQRAHRRLQRVDREEVPVTALPYYNDCLTYFTEKMGGPIPTISEKAMRAIGGAASGLASTVAARLAPKPKEGEGANGEADTEAAEDSVA
jgi:hypothetical protein